MKLLQAFLRLIRWPNLLFIARTEVLFYYAVAVPVLQGSGYLTREMDVLFWILVASSVLIAAGGYIINDYFDLNIDLVNKPERLVVDRAISRRWAIFWHLFFSVAGINMGFYIGLQNGNWLIGLANTAVVLLLWLYSTTFKKRLLSGNILIALLTGWTVLIVYFFIIYQRFDWLNHPLPAEMRLKLLRLTLLYTAFAFLITLIREVVKDIEDVEGDRRYGCRTLPIVWGVEMARIFAVIWMVVLLALLLVVLFYILQYHMWVPAFYNVLLSTLPAAWCLKLLLAARTTADYARLSSWIKGVILSGILSMLLLKYFG